ncbi:MAG: 16S rRNA (adenine(1518)-N(6)/adenine(1519)-N(6))-dimethyltransferase RsmA [Bacteroidaceae bacterium]|nr:16S rRNA (adenine(1518)-N(6)/adenine(1519)-N(6))-dimethyltransferase RsmA [Bacteroidaceae bacterium]
MAKTVTAKKRLGQHFLVDLNIAQDIADTVDICPTLPVLEVGPGMGVLTRMLLEKKRPLKVVEIDEESVDYLRKNLPQLGDDNIIPDDFLKMHLDRLWDGEKFMLIGNYPYNISSQIFFKMLEYKEHIPYCSGMIQKEVGERLAATPGSKANGILSILIQIWYDVEYLFTVSEHVFSPPPKVKSAVVRMTRNSRTELECDEELLRRIVKATFNQRRKKLRNSIQNIVGKDSPILGDTVLDKRPEQLSIEEFISLTVKVQHELEEKGEMS